MIGKTLESAPRFPWGAIFWSAVAGTMLIVASYMGNRHLALAAVAPACLAAGCCLTRPRRFRARVTDTGLELESPRGMLAYSDIDMINVEGRSPSHSRAQDSSASPAGRAGTPREPRCARDELHAFLLEQLDRGREARVPQALAGFLADQQATFGSDRVWAYTAHAVIGPPRSNRTIRAFLVSLAVAGVLWVAAGALLREPGWVTAGLITALVCGLFSLATFAERSPHRHKELAPSRTCHRPSRHRAIAGRRPRTTPLDRIAPCEHQKDGELPLFKRKLVRAPPAEGRGGRNQNRGHLQCTAGDD